MLIVCPTCSTSYMIDPASLGRDGRTVRCGRCKNLWFAAPPSPVAGFVADVIAEAEAREAPAEPNSVTATAGADDFGQELHHTAAEVATAGESENAAQESLPADQAPSLVPSSEPALADEPRTDGEIFVARRTRMHAKRKEKRKLSKWTALILVLLGFNVALIGARNEVVRYLPQTASLFAAIGLPVNLRNLEFEDIKISKETQDGVTILIIDGKIVNTVGSATDVPRLRFAARNASGQEIYTWSMQPTRSILGPGDSLPFTSRLAAPPADAVDILVRFFTKQDIASGMK